MRGNYEMHMTNAFKLNSNVLCNNWGSGKTLPENTVKETVRLRVQTVSHPNVERR
jgi:hypothetical protein